MLAFTPYPSLAEITRIVRRAFLARAPRWLLEGIGQRLRIAICPAVDACRRGLDDALRLGDDDPARFHVCVRDVGHVSTHLAPVLYVPGDFDRIVDDLLDRLAGASR